MTPIDASSAELRRLLNEGWEPMITVFQNAGEWWWRVSLEKNGGDDSKCQFADGQATDLYAAVQMAAAKTLTASVGVPKE